MEYGDFRNVCSKNIYIIYVYVSSLSKIVTLFCCKYWYYSHISLCMNFFTKPKFHSFFLSFIIDLYIYICFIIPIFRHLDDFTGILKSGKYWKKLLNETYMTVLKRKKKVNPC